MSFTLVACSDIRAQKVNLELPFERPPPSVEVLRDVLESVFRREEEVIKRDMGYTDVRPCEPFTINRLQRYDDDTQSWSEITSIDMLQTYDQLYVFRKNSTKADISTQRELPAPRPSAFFDDPTATTSAVHARGGSRGGVAPSEPPTQTSFHTPRAGNRPGANGDYNGSRHDVSPASQPRVSAGGSSYAVAPSALPSSSGRPSGRYDGANGAAVDGPDAYSASTALPGVGRTSTGAAGADVGAAPSPSSYYYRERTTPERVDFLFRLGSQPNGGTALTEKTFERVFHLANVAFPVEVHQDLFQHFANGDGGRGQASGTMNYEGFQEFATYFPVLINITYQRITNQDREEGIRNAQRDNAKQLEQARRQVQELESRLAAARKAAQEGEQRHARLQEDLSDIAVQRDPNYCRDEQRLLDKEVSVFKYRERLSREEQDYERLAVERRKRAAAASARTRSNSPQGAYDPNRYGPRD
ncbi:hypothetical protein ABB37_01694 [Leptomonas pyrrhocoris]|uniref:BILBO1 N-terminal domain-containing protein n=1 Tax=Leptomonas pyrrhocoris TaxID=157538 RepID=A0A0N0VHI4_LEPPY|nr:hypothetical protein ABB37_01694 [Leptomonas pyrrhocoris]KPA85378.1 hypothetical protein ABB37_01694 [Leptomonas pyrrhocoris]|eukprot:XP_015663817.1 hypothetical protein ABB37_01694 [Leptomonas pyrrhocoris]